jgi:hypothetical protein
MRAWLAALPLLASCATSVQTATENGKVVNFGCERGTMLSVTFFPDHAMLSANGEAPVRLEAQPVASGLSYMAPTRSIRGKGTDLTYNFARMAPEACTEIKD